MEQFWCIIRTEESLLIFEKRQILLVLYQKNKKLRSSTENTLDWKTSCFLRTKAAEQKYSTVARVQTLPLVEMLIRRCMDRGDDYLVAEEAIYHISCMNRFRLQINRANKRGRPLDSTMMEIISDVREMTADKSKYPSNEELSDINYETKWVPESLQIFLSSLISSNLKQLSIGQCIVQASRPRSLIVPIPFGVGVDVDKSFGTKWLVDHLAKFGFSVTSDEVKLLKQSAATSQVTTFDGQELNFAQ